MGILDGIVAWIAEQVMHGLDLINTSVLGALGCDMAVFLRYFPAAETMYNPSCPKSVLFPFLFEYMATNPRPVAMIVIAITFKFKNAATAKPTKNSPINRLSQRMLSSIPNPTAVSRR